ncbi:MAG: hypothetical protein A2X86_09220 [Bdellovibrionales bacterium GWA2_49_15]|nr:MAG: hypothetical protein A2X86_09220 [Bdellovibrionales bacterium GWA2_49_15]HAZ12958.1 hypothetical protein [Bdellovibrionales bacterium]
MPFFKTKNYELTPVKMKNFKSEKELQTLVEKNLGTIFNFRFVATEFSTGAVHSGRIDTLALSEDNNPVIIEYKIQESSDLINQSLFYLSWIKDHQGDFQVVSQKALDGDVDVDWDDIRVICIAPGFKKYDLHAVQMMGANIELWQYKFFEDGTLHLDQVFTNGSTAVESGEKNPVMVAAGKKAAVTRATGSYSFDEHLQKTEDEQLREIVLMLREYILEIDEAVEESPKKLYVAYKVAQNFACMEIQSQKITFYLKLIPNEIKPFPANARDVTNLGHYGTGRFEFTVKNAENAEDVKKYIRQAFEEIGG